MTTVVRRDVVSSPVRDAHQTWLAIVDLLTRACPAEVREELTAVSGTAASVIGDQAAAKAPIVVTCEGPRTRIYCLYDDHALDGSDSNEAPLGFDPLKGDWAISLPCPAEDLAWVENSLARHSTRITARDVADGIAAKADQTEQSAGGLTFNPQGFLGS